MQRLVREHTVSDEVPPVSPANHSTLGDLIVSHHSRSSLVGIEAPWAEIHELRVEIFIEAFWRLPCHRHDVENASFLTCLGRSLTARELEAAVVRCRLWLLDKSSYLAQEFHGMEA